MVRHDEQYYTGQYSLVSALLVVDSLLFLTQEGVRPAPFFNTKSTRSAKLLASTRAIMIDDVKHRLCNCNVS